MITTDQGHELEKLKNENAGTSLQIKEGLEDDAIECTLTIVIDRWGHRHPHQPPTTQGSF